MASGHDSGELLYLDEYDLDDVFCDNLQDSQVPELPAGGSSQSHAPAAWHSSAPSPVQSMQQDTAGTCHVTTTEFDQNSPFDTALPNISGEGTRPLADMWLQASRSSMPGFHSRQNAEWPALGSSHQASASCLPLPMPNVSTYTHMRSNANSTFRMSEDAAWQRSTLAHLHHERSSQLVPAREEILERQNTHFSTDSHSHRTPKTDSPASAFTAHGSGGFENESPSMPAHNSGGNACFKAHSNVAAAGAVFNSQTPTKQGPGAFTRGVLCRVPSGLSRDSTTTTQVGTRDGSPQNSPTSNVTADHQPFIPNQAQIDNHLTYSASLVSGSSRKRKAQVEQTPDSNQEVMDIDTINSFHIRAVPASILLPNLGTPSMQPHSMQPLQHVSAVQQMKCTPSSQPYVASAIANCTNEVPPFKRQRLSHSSGSWGSSSSAQLLHSSYLVPTPGQGCDPHGLEVAKKPAWGNNHYASSATAQFYHMGQVPMPMQISSGPEMDSQAYFQADPHAGPQMTPQPPSHAASQEASMAPPQAPTQTTPQAPASNKRAVLQAGQVVWARWYKGWWPAMVQNPNQQQQKHNKRRDGTVGVVYFGTGEVGALHKHQVMPWPKRAVPRQPHDDYRTALRQAVRAVAGGAPL